MKFILTSVSALAAATTVATAQISGFSLNIVSGVMEFGMIAPNPSFCGVIGGCVLVGIIGARRLKIRN
jgi:hypothetical protein